MYRSIRRSIRSNQSKMRSLLPTQTMMQPTTKTNNQFLVIKRCKLKRRSWSKLKRMLSTINWSMDTRKMTQLCSKSSSSLYNEIRSESTSTSLKKSVMVSIRGKAQLIDGKSMTRKVHYLNTGWHKMRQTSTSTKRMKKLKRRSWSTNRDLMLLLINTRITSLASLIIK